MFAGAYGQSSNSGNESDFVRITPLGAGQEVGRSCHIIEFKGKTIMLDCGIHPGKPGLSGLPYLDMIDAASIDLLLITHFHLDHAAALPYFLEKTDFKGKVYMTHPTKSIYKLILMDYVKVSTISVEETLYDEKDLLNSMKKIDCLNFHQVVHHNGIKFWCYNAGHVLGAAMFMIEIAGVRILYTGDYSCREDRHLMAAEIPPMKPDILIVEATYGVQTLQSVEDREKRLTDAVHRVIRRGGRVLIPVFALGRAQELLLILDEYWEANPSLQDYPVYYASALAKKCMSVYQAYIHMMNRRIQSQLAISNPFVFKHISNLKGMDKFDDIGPSVVMASPGMLQSGLSRELFELWCSDPKNGVIIAGYSVEGTLAKTVMSEPSHITTLSGLRIPRNMSVDVISFSAHADCSETTAFIEALKPTNVVLVHGEKNEMERLQKEHLQKIYADGSITISAPANCQAVQIEIRPEKFVKVVGRLAGAAPKESSPSISVDEISGLVVRKDFADRIIAVDDLPLYTPLSATTISHRMKVPFVLPSFDLVSSFLNEIYTVRSIYVDEEPEDEMLIEVSAPLRSESSVSEKVLQLKVLDRITISQKDSYVLLEWDANPISDMVADSVASLLMTIDVSPATARLLYSGHCHGREETESTSVKRRRTVNEGISKFLNAFFDEEVTYNEDQSTFSISMRTGESVVINLDNLVGFLLQFLQLIHFIDS